MKNEAIVSIAQGFCWNEFMQIQYCKHRSLVRGNEYLLMLLIIKYYYDLHSLGYQRTISEVVGIVLRYGEQNVTRKSNEVQDCSKTTGMRVAKHIRKTKGIPVWTKHKNGQKPLTDSNGHQMGKKQIGCVVLPREKQKGIKLFQARNYCPFIAGIANSNACIRRVTTTNT